MAQKVFSLTITVLDDGTTSLSGPLDNKTLCYGLLESAKDSVREYHERKVKGNNGSTQMPKLDFNISNDMVKKG